MKKIIFTTICALALCAIPAQANPQTEEVNETAVVVEQQPKKSFWNGFLVSAGAGAQITMTCATHSAHASLPRSMFTLASGSPPSSVSAWA